ncbi:MAG TPA: hypothetical protein VKE74_08640 [Gemmataceae bacterium]|nr:hypothetical protein [Gemmataceae bacterium]
MLPFLAFAGGLLLGVLVTVLFVKKIVKSFVELPPPDITQVTCLSGGSIQIDGSASPTVDNLTLAGLYSEVYDVLPTTIPPTPPATAVYHGTSFPLFRTLPSGLSGPTDYVVVWAEYSGYRSRTYEYSSCSGSGSGVAPGDQIAHVVSAAVTEELEAIPRTYRVSPGSSPAGAVGGPADELGGAVARAPEAVLQYVPEASTPIEPFWRARGGPGPVVEWSLCLLYRSGGFGAVLSAVCLIDGRNVRLTWVTSDWRFHAVNRLACESDDAGVPVILVRPA